MFQNNTRARRFASLTVTLLASTIVLAACDDDPVEPIVPVEWLATLTGDEIDGIASASSAGNAFDAAIEIEGAEADAVFTWDVSAGTCAAPGARIGAADDYPDLEVAEDGTAAAEAEVSAALDEEGAYIVRVRDETGQAAVTVACGALEVDE